MPQPMDIEWAKDGVTGELVHRAGAPGDGPFGNRARRRRGLSARPAGRAAARRPGRRSASEIGAGPARSCDVSALDEVQAGDVLVAEMTDPDWEPVMRRVAAIVTDKAAAPRTRRSSRASSACRASSAPGAATTRLRTAMT